MAWRYAQDSFVLGKLDTEQNGRSNPIFIENVCKFIEQGLEGVTQNKL